MSSVAVARRPVVLADVLPRTRVHPWVRTGVLVVAFALLTGAAAQFSIKLSWTPVPITGQTFAVLLAGTTLGWRAGASSMALYWVLGLFLPFYAGGERGWEFATGATFGYFVGFVLAAAAVGALAEKGQDRSLATSIPAMLAGTAVIYTCGVAWLVWNVGMPLAEGTPNAISGGVAPFLVGDAAKLMLAGLLTPLAWKFASRD